MTNPDQTSLATDTRRRHLHGPRFTPLDVAGLVAIAAMIWGPLLAGVLRQ